MSMLKPSENTESFGDKINKIAEMFIVSGRQERETVNLNAERLKRQLRRRMRKNFSN